MKTPPFRMAWPASGQRACLTQSMEGFAQNAALHRHCPEMLISVDAALHPAMEAAYREALHHIRRRYGFAGSLFTPEGRQSLYAPLGDICPEEVLRYALESSPDGPGFGCNVNASMLLSAGRFLLSTDDDIFARPVVPRHPAEPDKAEGAIPAAFRYYPSPEALLADVSPVQPDILGSYGALLGNTPPNGTWTSVVCPGIYGDSASGASHTIVLLKDGDRRHLHELGYGQMRLTRELLRVVPAPTLTPALFFMATQFAADSRSVLPPFLTYGRNIDGAFMLALRVLYRHSLTGHLPFGLQHRPPVQRQAVPADLSRPYRALSEILMALIIQNIPPDEMDSTEERFAFIGDCIRQAAALPGHRFQEYAHEAVCIKQMAIYENMMDLRERYADESAPQWVADIDALMETTEETLREPSSLFGAEGCGLSVARARWHIDMYGRLLQYWPRLHSRCAEMFSEKQK